MYCDYNLQFDPTDFFSNYMVTYYPFRESDGSPMITKERLFKFRITVYAERDKAGIIRSKSIKFEESVLSETHDIYILAISLHEIYNEMKDILNILDKKKRERFRRETIIQK